MGSTVLNSPAVTGNRVCLRPVSQNDLPTLYEWRGDLLQFDLLGWLKNTVTFEEFSRDFSQHLRHSTNFVMADGESDEPIGMVFAYDMNFADGWCHVLVYADDEHRSQARGREAAFLFWDYLFTNFRLRKIYMEVFEFNQGWIESTPILEAGLLVEEGRFKGHHVFDGQTWDVIRLALYRERWMQMREFLFMLVGSKAPEISGASTEEKPPQQADRSSVSSGEVQPVDRGKTSSNVKHVRRFLQLAQAGDIESMTNMLARGAVHDGAISGESPARHHLKATSRDQRAMAARLGDEQLSALVEISWSRPLGDGNHVSVIGTTVDGQEMTLTWEFDVGGKISRWGSRGAPELIVAYYLRGVTADWL